MRRLAGALVAVAILAACAEPPNKEMNQAQGAIEAAKAAGAETYATAELAAAVDALRRSEDAVAQRDYRLALNYALESREQANAAAKAAATERTRTRGEVERQLADAAAIVARARGRLDQPDVSRLPRRVLQETRATLDAAGESVQEARTALNGDEYERARKALAGIAERIQKANAALDAALASAPAPRKRR